MFRAEAVSQGMSLAVFGRYAEAHPEVDRELDRRMQALAAPGRILEGRLQGPLCRRAATPVHSIVVDASEAQRARRIATRDGVALDAALAAMRVREASERTRYLAFYGIDLAHEPSDLTVDSTRQDAPTVARAIVEYLNRVDGGP